jgi:hypothetical protein
MHAIAPTKLHRVTLDQQGRVAIDAQAYGDGAFYRAELGGCRVTLLTPPGGRIMLSIDEPIAEAGQNRTQYKWPPLPEASVVQFFLFEGQALYGSAEQGKGLVTFGLIVERLDAQAAAGR